MKYSQMINSRAKLLLKKLFFASMTIVNDLYVTVNYPGVYSMKPSTDRAKTKTNKPIKSFLQVARQTPAPDADSVANAN